MENQKLRERIWNDIKKARLLHYKTYFTYDGEQVRELLQKELKKIILGKR